MMLTPWVRRMRYRALAGHLIIDLVEDELHAPAEPVQQPHELIRTADTVFHAEAQDNIGTL